jgi:uncharacterized protein YjbJ (UPF0337 family)
MAMQYVRQTLKRILGFSLMVVMVTTIVFSFPTHANALNDAGQVVKERAKRELDSKTSVGTGDEIEGQLKQNAGKVQRQFGDSREGMARQLEGEAQENAAKARRGTQELAEDTQNKATGIVDSIKDFFD